MNGFSAAAASPPIPPLNSTSEISRPPLPTTRPEFSSFKFKTIGQPPTLLSRLSGAGAASDYRTPSPEPSDMDITPSDDPPMMVSEGNRTVHASRKSLLDTLGENADHTGHNSTITTARTQDPGVLEPTFTSPLSASSSDPTLPRPESRLSSDFRGLSVAVDVPRAEASPWLSVAPGTYAHEPPDSDMTDLYTDPDSPSRFPLSLFSDLSEAVRESAELDRITTLHHQLSAEREELLTRHDETTRALSRTKTQLDRVLSLTEEAIKITTVFVDKEKTRLDIKKAKVETRIEHKKNLETERRKAKELERIRQHEEEQKAQIEMEQQAERQRLDEQRKKEEILAAERKRQEEIQARERAQAEERRRLDEERQRLAEDQRRREDEERKRRAEEEQQKEEEERLRKRLAEEREALARKQEEDRRNQLLERRRLAEEERKQKEAESAAAKAEAEKQAAEKEQQRIFQERRATALKDKWKNYNRPEFGVPPTGSPPSIPEGTSSSNLPSITVNDIPTNPHAATEHYPGFVPATTEAGRLPPDLSQKVKVSDSLVDYAVKYETTSPVIVPVDNDQPMEDNPPTQLSSRSVSSMSTSAPAPVPAPLPAPPHLPQKPVTLHSKPPVQIQQSGRSPRRYSTQRSRSRSQSPSPRRGSPSPRMPSRASRSPDAARGRYKSPPTNRRKVDHYSPPRPSYRGGGSRYERDSRSDSPPPPPPPNSRKRALQVSEDSWAKASTPSKLDYSHPSKRRAVSPLRSRTPPSPPPIVPSRRLPRSGGRGRGGGPPQSQSHLSLEQRLSRQLSERIQ